MVKSRKEHTNKKHHSKGFVNNRAKARKINACTPYDTCSEQLSPFGGLLALIKFLDLFKFNQILDCHYKAPPREPEQGHHRMLTALLMLLFIGFNRVWHFTYLRLDAIICGFFHLERLPVASTFWRYVNSMGINQGVSLLLVMNTLRERAWKLLGINYFRINVDIDTTVETLYGHQQGGRKGHNTQHRGKKGYRPVLCFIEQTREYLFGKLRVGETISGQQFAGVIGQIKACLPGCVRQVLLRADAEFISWQSVQAAHAMGFDFIFANKGCDPKFNSNAWYRPHKREDIEFNSFVYQPIGWDRACRFVAMRIPKTSEDNKPRQMSLFDEDHYKYRIFCTSLGGRAHEVIERYDKRADVENLIGEAKREGLGAIPSTRFKNNYAFFQVVMLAYNIWRYMKLLATKQVQPDQSDSEPADGIVANTIRIARLKLLLIAAKVVKEHNRDKVKYSIHDARTPVMLGFLQKLDRLRSLPWPWGQNEGRGQKFALT